MKAALVRPAEAVGQTPSFVIELYCCSHSAFCEILWYVPKRANSPLCKWFLRTVPSPQRFPVTAGDAQTSRANPWKAFPCIMPEHATQDSDGASPARSQNDYCSSPNAAGHIDGGNPTQSTDLEPCILTPRKKSSIGPPTHHLKLRHTREFRRSSAKPPDSDALAQVPGNDSLRIVSQAERGHLLNSIVSTLKNRHIIFIPY